MSWRYQPVIVTADPPGESYVCLIEVYLTEEGRLSNWSEPLSSTPSGEDGDEMCRDLARMLVNARCWPVVRYDDLQVGMTFTALVTREQREDLARGIEQWIGRLSATDQGAPTAETAAPPVDSASATVKAVRQALFPPPVDIGNNCFRDDGADHNLEGALYDLKRTGADAICIKTIERVLEQLQQARAAFGEE
jgi:hypothetical protein